MRELVAKIGRFCEQHVEKIVFALIVPVCAYIFFTRVIFSPNAITLDGKTFTPGNIDTYVNEKADVLRDALARTQKQGAQEKYTSLLTGPIEPNNPVVADVFTARPAPESFESLFEDPLSFLHMGETEVRPVTVASGREYALPSIGQVTDVAVNHIRAAAYVPVVPISTTRGYSQGDCEPNDIDLVTVEAKFDVARLYNQFHAYFDGTEVEDPAWRDPCLAVPKFAAVQIQRQKRMDNGAWSDWTAVPRSRVEQYGQLFTPIEKLEDLPPGGLKVRMMQFNSMPITMALLQPESYQIASAEEDWLPPSFYDKFKSLQRKVEMEERRKEREERQSQKEADEAAGATTGRRGGTRDRATTTSGRRGTTGDTGLTGTNRRGGTRNTRGTRGRGDTTADARNTTRTGRRGGANAGPYDVGVRGEYGAKEVVSTDEAYVDYMQALITYNTDLSKLDEPLLFWAFDDTAEPGNTYRYRIRLGVFNPVAGTGEVVERDKDKNDQVILWSQFSQTTEPVAIPQRIYFFAKDVQDRAQAATVEVARYELGYWYTEDFQVRPGEVIGREMEPPKKKEDDKDAAQTNERITGAGGRNAALLQMRNLGLQTSEPDDPTTPEMVDYGTNAMLVDLVEATDLGSPPNLQPRPYHDMLYTMDGATIEHMPVSQRYWPTALQQAYSEILGERNKDHQPFRAFRSSSRGRGGMMNGGRGMPYGGGGPYGGAYGG